MRLLLRIGAASLAFVLFLTPSTDARSAPRRGARVVWARGEGADTCLGAAGLEEDVKSRLGWDPFVLPKELEVEGTARRTSGGFRADLAFRDREGKPIGKRELQSRDKDCRTLGEAVAVAITIAIDPDASGSTPPPVIEVPPATTEAPLPPPPPPRSRTEERAHGRIVLAGGATGGLVPGPSAIASLRAGLVFADFVEIDVGASYAPPTREGAYGFGLTTGEARGCVLPWGTRGTLGLLRFCGAALVGAFETFVHTGTVTPVDVGAFPWVGAAAGVGLSVDLGGPLRLDLDVGGIVPIVRREGIVRGTAAPVWEQSLVAGRAELGLGVLF